MTDNPFPALFRLSLAGGAPLPDAFRGAVVAIGNFDGVHRGHQALLAAAASEAKGLGAKLIALTFEPHPRAVLQPGRRPFPLTTPRDKQFLLGAAGADAVAALDFDMSVASLHPDDFATRILHDQLGARAVFVGADFRFGKGRAGDIATLRSLGDRLGFAAIGVSPVLDDKSVAYGSGGIRRALSEGRIRDANDALGYRWFTGGTVIHGDKRGRELGFPTANIALPPEAALRFGIYAVTAAWPDQATRPAVASFGVRPTFGENLPLLEVHLFDFDGDLYGKDMKVGFLDWLRPEERFTGIDALVEQIARDAEEARSINAGAGAGTTIDQAVARWAAVDLNADAVAAESPIA